MLTENEIKVTQKAANRLKEVIDEGERLRLEVDGGGCSGFEYKIRLDKKMNDDDLVWKTDSGAEIIVDEMSLGYIKGATVDYVEDLMKASFRIVNNPVAEKGCSCGSSFAPKMD
uniref:Fe-S_biosyn domain-containing protein n=1 Tax=Caenorhabditis tropicalis TaxID=1561998 RepID=A0A1I7U7P3_9PELO